MLLGTLFAEGFVLDGLEEPMFGANAKEESLFETDQSFSSQPRRQNRISSKAATVIITPRAKG